VVPVIALIGLRQTYAHRVHPLGERLDGLHQDLVFKILHDFLAISDRVEIIQTRVEEGREIVVPAASRDGFHDLIEIQITREDRRFACFLPGGALGCCR